MATTRKTKTDYGYMLNGWHIIDLRHLNDSFGIRWTVTNNIHEIVGDGSTWEDFGTLAEAVEFASATWAPLPRFLRLAR